MNKYISALRNVVDPTEFTHCECSQTSESPCGPGSECINRMLQIECDKTCKTQDKCQNQRFQKCQQVDCVPIKTAHCGWGLRTRQGTYIEVLFSFVCVAGEQSIRRMERPFMQFSMSFSIFPQTVYIIMYTYMCLYFEYSAQFKWRAK